MAITNIVLNKKSKEKKTRSRANIDLYKNSEDLVPRRSEQHLLTGPPTVCSMS